MMYYYLILFAAVTAQYSEPHPPHQPHPPYPPRPSPPLHFIGPLKHKKAIESLEYEVRSFIESTGPSDWSDYHTFLRSLSSSSTFKSVIWERVPFKVSSELFAHRFSFHHQLSLFKDGNLSMSGPKNHMVDKRVGAGEVHSFMADSSLKSLFSSSVSHDELCIGMLEEGRTLVVDSAECLHPVPASISRAFSNAFGVPFVGVNMYTTRAGQDVSAPLHTDKMDSFIIQMEGSKLWRVFEPTEAIIHPLEDIGMPDRGKNGDILYLEEVGDMLLDLRLDEGDILYVPRGFPHATSTHRSFISNTKGTHTRRDTWPFLNVSLSFTVSLLSGSVGLTYDKLLRCTATQFLCLDNYEALYCPARLEAVRLSRKIGNLRRSVFYAPHTMNTSGIFVAGLSERNMDGSATNNICTSTEIKTRWICAAYRIVMKYLNQVVRRTQEIESLYKERLKEFLLNLSWTHEDLSLMSEEEKTCTMNSGARCNDLACQKLRHLVYNLISQVYTNICNAFNVADFITGVGMEYQECSDLQEKANNEHSVWCAGGANVSTIEKYNRKCYNGKFIDINERQQLVSDLLAQYRFIPSYCQEI